MVELLRLALSEVSGPLAMLACLGVLVAGALILAVVEARRNGLRSPAAWLFTLTAILGVCVLVATLAKILPFETSVAKVWLFLRPMLPVLGGLVLALVAIAAASLVFTRFPAGAGIGLFVVATFAGLLVWLRFEELDEAVVKPLTSVPPDSQFAQTPIRSPDTAGREVLIPAGPFIQGSLSELQMQVIVGNVEGDERPVRSSYLDDYFIDRYEVDNDSFSEFVSATGHVTDAESITRGRRWGADGWVSDEELTWREPMFIGDSIAGRGSHPVVQVSWNDAVAYCRWAGKRLPTDAEWEKAARGPYGNLFPWGNEFDGTLTNSCDTNCADLPQHKNDDFDDGFRTTAPVGSYPDGVSPYGVHDMAGNVWEWVNDAYDPYYYYYAPEYNPGGPILADITHRIVRGGSFTSEIGYVRTTSKSFDPPETAYFGVGFRCARTAD